jgi:hypothetical protein
MKNLKFALIGIGLVAIICMFTVSVTKGIKITLWDIRKFKGSFFYIPFLGFLATAAMGGLAAMKGSVEKWMGGVAAGGSALGALWLLKEGTKGAGTGYWLIVLLGIAGAAVGGMLAAKGEEG